MSKGSVRVTWESRGTGKALQFEFPEELTLAAAEEALRAWRKELDAAGGAPVTIVWDCRRMKGYDSQARKVWQDALQELKSRIGTVWLVSGSSFVRLGAMLMGKALSIEIRSVDSPQAIAL